MRKILAIILGAAVLAASVPTPVAASSLKDEAVTHVARVDVSSGRVNGERAQFYIDLPKAWKDSVTAERDLSVTDDEALLEQLNFYCGAISGIYKPQPLLSLYVFKREKWADDGKYEPVCKSRSYVFAVKYGVSAFTLRGDIAVYNAALSVVSKPSKLAKTIKVANWQELPMERAVLVDGERLFYDAEIVNSVYYVRLREAAAAMGYGVTWDGKAGTIRVSKGNFSDTFAINHNREDWRGIKMYIRDGRAYVSTAYFIRILGKTVEIDKRKNVYFYTE